MNKATIHRGPDFTGSYTDGSVTLGHNLLSIRDASELSKQPVTKPDSPWVLIFNGQIYNTKKICEKFSLPHYDLDTTIIYELIEKVGWDFIGHIQGMFAIGLYNEREKVIRLYRDHSGQKPLYYAPRPGMFVFSSEIKGILAAGVRAETDSEGLMIAGALGYIPGNLTLLKGVYKINAGEMVTVREDGTFTCAYYENKTTGHFTGEPDAVMRQLVTEHLASKQKVALNLSGGMDSSLLLHEMKEAGHELITYTTSFKDTEERFNEDAKIAGILAKDYGTRHTEIEITKETYLKNFVESYELIEEPNYNISLPTYLAVAKREGIQGDGNRVILSGDGGDEIFGGYPEYIRAQRYGHLMNAVTPLGFSIGKWIRGNPWWNYREPIEEWLAFKYFSFNAMPLERNAITRYAKNIASTIDLKGAGAVRSMMYLDRAFWMAGENFIRSDKLCMSQTLEMRSPLAYGPLRTYFDARLSENDLVDRDGNKKYLRELYAGKLPDYVVKRMKKTGWRSPIETWYDRECKNLFLSILSNAPRGGRIQWDRLMKQVEEKETWPGKYTHLYLSLAILSKKFGIVL